MLGRGALPRVGACPWCPWCQWPSPTASAPPSPFPSPVVQATAHAWAASTCCCPLTLPYQRPPWRTRCRGPRPLGPRPRRPARHRCAPRTRTPRPCRALTRCWVGAGQETSSPAVCGPLLGVLCVWCGGDRGGRRVWCCGARGSRGRAPAAPRPKPPPGGPLRRATRPNPAERKGVCPPSPPPPSTGQCTRARRAPHPHRPAGAQGRGARGGGAGCGARAARGLG